MNITDLGRRIDTGEHRMNSMEERLDTSFALLSSQILQSRRETNDAILAMRADLSGDITALRTEMSGMRSETQGCFEKFETTLVVGLEDARHYMKLLYEDLVGRIALLGEAWAPRQ